MLFNPLRESEKGHTALFYLNDLLGKDLLLQASQKGEYGYMIMILEGKELEELVIPIAHNFYLKNIYKTKQNDNTFVLLVQKRGTPLEIKQGGNPFAKQTIEYIKRSMELKTMFNLSQYGQLSYAMPHCDYKKMKSINRNIDKHKSCKSLSNNQSWKWIIEKTNYEKSKNQKINKPTELTTGETANLIASGIINGEMRKGEDFHIVAGGIKHKERVSYSNETNKQGELVYTKSTLFFSQPYLNVLVNDGTKTYIKELGGESDYDDTLY